MPLLVSKASHKTQIQDRLLEPNQSKRRKRSQRKRTLRIWRKKFTDYWRKVPGTK
tara:strand:+ start:140 stop:304 length:165 start_codon:yes stop_codon:yes gene_type:complete